MQAKDVGKRAEAQSIPAVEAPVVPRRPARRVLRFALLGASGACAAALAGDPTTSRVSGEAAAATPVPAPSAAPASSAVTLPPPNPLDALARKPATDVSLAPSPGGRLGAWLVAGPFPARGNRATALGNAPNGVDEAAMAPRLGDDVGPPGHVKWQIIQSNDGAIDLGASLGTKSDDQIAYVAGTLHLEHPGKFYFFLGADDGESLSIDGKRVFARDESRPERDDDDVVTQDLAAGDHPLVLKLHQRDGGWGFHVRFVDENLDAPEGAYVALPGTTADDAAKLAAKMSWISVERGVGGAGYAPKLTVRFPEGAPRGVPIHVHAKMVRGEAPHLGRHGEPMAATDVRHDGAATGDDGVPVFDVDAGEVPVDAAGAGELVAILPQLGESVLPRIEDHDWSIQVDVAGRALAHGFYPRRAVREAILHADHALDATPDDATWLREGSKDSVAHLRDVLARFTGKGDADLDADFDEAKELEALAASLDQHADPYASRTGPMRRAYRSPIDGELSEYGLYVPPTYGAEPDKHYPLVIGLHGMNGNGMSVLRWLFGYDDPTKDSDWENRHMPDHLPALDAVVVTPDAYGNAMYRDEGEDDVMNVADWAIRAFPIDKQKVTITGMSMGGIGTAAIAFHHPGLFAAAEPLCGYHSYFIRRDYGGRPVRPWEHLIADERSNVSWAYNGFRVPLYIVHGTKDLPEANSGVLIDRYKELGYWLKHEHPDLGHNVWSDTYEGLKGLRWLLWHKKDLHPKTVRMRTIRTRFGDNAWVHIDALSSSEQWGEIQAHVRGPADIDATTTGIAELRFDRDPELMAASGPLNVRIDGESVAVDGDADGKLWLHKEGGHWAAGRATHAGVYKHEDSTGPLRDVFHQPIVFVYGADDPTQKKMNEEVARSFARVRWGVTVKYPVMSDAEFLAKGEPLDGDRALFLVGNAKSNRVLRALDADLPIRVDGDAVVLGDKRFTGRELGAAFIRPNPRRPDRYIVVVEGVDTLGTWRAMSLPDLLPDFLVYDARLAPARGQQLLSSGMVLAGGFFQNDWSLPEDTSDPSARNERPGAKSEYDATPYLP